MVSRRSLATALWRDGVSLRSPTPHLKEKMSQLIIGRINKSRSSQVVRQPISGSFPLLSNWDIVLTEHKCRSSVVHGSPVLSSTNKATTSRVLPAVVSNLCYNSTGVQVLYRKSLLNCSTSITSVNRLLPPVPIRTSTSNDDLV